MLAPSTYRRTSTYSTALAFRIEGESRGLPRVGIPNGPDHGLWSHERWRPSLELFTQGILILVPGSLLAVYRLESSLHFQLPLPLGRKGIWALRAASQFAAQYVRLEPEPRTGRLLDGRIPV